MGNRAHHRPRAADPIGAAPVPADMQAMIDDANLGASVMTQLAPEFVTFHVAVRPASRGGVAEPAVRLTRITHSGVVVSFLPPALARELHTMLGDAITQAESGLTIAGPADVPTSPERLTR